jgi:hypothetical protein
MPFCFVLSCSVLLCSGLCCGLLLAISLCCSSFAVFQHYVILLCAILLLLFCSLLFWWILSGLFYFALLYSMLFYVLFMQFSSLLSCSVMLSRPLYVLCCSTLAVLWDFNFTLFLWSVLLCSAVLQCFISFYFSILCCSALSVLWHAVPIFTVLYSTRRALCCPALYSSALHSAGLLYAVLTCDFLLCTLSAPCGCTMYCQALCFLFSILP